jgi:hypothetical protein
MVKFVYQLALFVFTIKMPMNSLSSSVSFSFWPSEVMYAT